MAYGGNANTNTLSDETFDFLCVVCKRKGQYIEAEKYCVECQDYNCLSCVKVHDNFPKLTGHTVFGKGRFPSGLVKTRSISQNTPSQELTERCDIHSHNCIDMYCQNHDVVGCGTCMAIDHRSCQDIFYLLEYVKQNPSKIKDIKRKLKTVIKTINEHFEKLNKEKQQLNDMIATTLEHIKKVRKEINEKLDELEEYSKAAAVEKYTTLFHEIEEEFKMLKTNKSSATFVKQNLDISSSTASQTFINSKKVETIARKAAGIIERRKSNVSSTNFTPDHTLSSLLDEIIGLGYDIKLSSQKESKSSKKGNKMNDLYQVNGKKKYSVKGRCNYVSACTLEDGTILLSDNYSNNLQRLHSTTYIAIDSCDLPGLPWQVCSINKQHAAVCMTDQREVHFISLTDKMKITNKISTDFECYGLAYANGNLYISDRYISVYIYSVSGRKLKEISTNQEEYEASPYIRSLTVSQDGSTIYVSDFQNGLILLDKNGTVYHEYYFSGLHGAYGSCLAGEGSLLVCGFQSNNVLQFDMNGESIGEVLKFSDKNLPQAVCCNQQMSKMIICKYYDDEIEVFDVLL